MTTISADLTNRLAALAAASDAVEVLLVFGSAARGRLTSESDVDLYVRLARPWTTEAERAFREAAATICHRDVDLVVESATTSVILRHQAAGHGRCIFERRPGSFRQLVVDAIRAYVDLEPQLRLIGDAIRNRAIRDGAEAARRLRVPRDVDGR